MPGKLPPGVTVRSQGQGEERKVVLDIEGTTFELHPTDAGIIGEYLVVAAIDAENHENG